jgi:hypothetical protein
MMVYMGHRRADIEQMPRGGFRASCLDRRLETSRQEYLDREDVDSLKRTVVRSLDRLGEVFGLHERFAGIVLNEIADVPDPKVLELGSGHGGLSRALLTMHPSAHVTVTDVEPGSVAAIAAGDLGSHPRATVREMNATAIDAPDGCYDLAVFAMSFHHLRPALASQVFAEGTRAADKLLIIDLARPPAPLHLLRLALTLPLSIAVPLCHDGFISSLRAYSPSAMRALARHADPAISLDLRGGGLDLPFRPRPQIVVASRLHSAR